jgi:hypothetical protein
MIRDNLQRFKKILEAEMKVEEYELAPGLVMRVQFDSDTRDTITRFLNKKATFRELRKMK